ncbi:hypothetical protein [Streptomyces sp. NPDC058304]|uniref:hypothetical protein n=1 Tax=Streptomyces sp. NPDC058304 TaxID=3346437 RepID=UPI0036E1A996
MLFYDHRQAGEQQLTLRLLERVGDGDLTDTVDPALPRGGVPVAAEVARALHVPLDVLVARKIGVPGHPEVGIGAIAGEDPPSTTCLVPLSDGPERIRPVQAHDVGSALIVSAASGKRPVRPGSGGRDGRRAGTPVTSPSSTKTTVRP